MNQKTFNKLKKIAEGTGKIGAKEIRFISEVLCDLIEDTYIDRDPVPGIKTSDKESDEC